MKISKLIKQPRVIILIIFLLISFFSINHQFSKQGLVVSSVEFNSAAYQVGLRTPSAEVSPTAREKVLEINDKLVNSVEEFYNVEKLVPLNGTVRIKTTKSQYAFLKDSLDLGIIVTEAPSSNLRKGLDLQGGTRVLLRPEGELTDQDIKDIIDTMENRLNIYGLADVTIKSASDLEGNKFIVVEIAGSTKEEIKNIMASNKHLSPNALMGIIMKKFKGKIDGKKVADALSKAGVKEEDALLVVISAIFELDAIVTYNRKHLHINKDRINEILRRHGLNEISILLPSGL